MLDASCPAGRSGSAEESGARDLSQPAEARLGLTLERVPVPTDEPEGRVEATPFVVVECTPVQVPAHVDTVVHGGCDGGDGLIRADIDVTYAARLISAVMDGLQQQWLLDESLDMAAAFDEFVRGYLLEPRSP